MCVSVSQLAELLLEIGLMRIRIAIQAQEINVGHVLVPAHGSTIRLQIKTWSICILVCVKENICSVILVITTLFQRRDTV